LTAAAGALSVYGRLIEERQLQPNLKRVFAGVAAVALASAAIPLSSAPAQAVLIDHGITYDLQLISGSLSTTTATFNLHITGINGATDTEGGRYGVNDFAFTTPANFSSALVLFPAGFSTKDGGLNANGCNGSGGFFCFNGLMPSGPVLDANSVIDLSFSVELSSGNFLGWDPHLKIDWVGTKNNYGLVSQAINITSVPGPVVGAGLPGLLGAMGALVMLARRRRRLALS
jgi:hypothetical protein